MRASWPGNSGGWGVGGRRELRNEPHHAALSGFGSGDCGVAAGEAGLGAGAGLGRQGRKPAPDFDGTNPFRLQILELIKGSGSAATERSGSAGGSARPRTGRLAPVRASSSFRSRRRLRQWNRCGAGGGRTLSRRCARGLRGRSGCAPGTSWTANFSTRAARGRPRRGRRLRSSHSSPMRRSTRQR